ncbi:Putative glycoside hydrolase, family 5, glycoside hydrolase superfamily, beta-glucuronidase [Septoria linicola]|uniref:Glycoside hydrolase, family 5, glycoside hydrolase superfamily, beta-glucuronidase n=1 Tax=Septoria linicola TaxID=215465 RepID=A0A9Q9AYE2_9PEZI|nr:putative glycoside hydrolase, family 5, glycoside hydrolase superfamily, beta-glucuronidase [Septoria linicola]USW52916.1 Putative glycoside hydrolase, family 5, glycoside hydrolase superfamily, beta-glucuronidase [Septoria linicola]
MPPQRGLLTLALASAATAHKSHSISHLEIPQCADGASIKHTPSFSSFSFEPAFWVEFFGNASSPNNFTFDAIRTLHDHGGKPSIRPGGITMDSMIFEANASNPIRTTNEAGGVYRTTVGPAYYESWSNFPEGTDFVSTLNFGNESLDIARDMAVASIKYQPELVKYFELGNEPTNYDPDRWANSTANYVKQWQEYTAAIDSAVNAEGGQSVATRLGIARWWASSATTDETPLHVRPADIIPAGIDSKMQVSEYSIHSYAFATCDPKRAALATIENILNHTGLVEYADTEIVPSAKAALDAGNPWIIGEFNSIACSGNPNVSDTFAQALWEVDTELIYAVRDASACYLHQGATLVFQSDQQSNSAGDDGSPGFSTYSMLYPITTSKRGPQRVNPGFAGLLFLAEAFANNDTRVQALDTPSDLSSDHFSAYAFYSEDKLSKLALINTKPYYVNSTSDYTASFNVFEGEKGYGRHGRRQAWVKRMTAPHVNEKDSSKVTWAGQSFRNATADGEVCIEKVGADGIVSVRGSEAVLVFYNEQDVYGLPEKKTSKPKKWYS